MLLDAIKRIAKKIRQYKASLLNCDADEQALFLKAFAEPRDDTERAYFQYRCQIKLLGFITSFVYRLSSVPLFFYYRKKLTGRALPEQSMCVCTLFLYDGIEDIIPESLKTRSVIQQMKGFQKNMSLSTEDLDFIRDLDKRYPMAWYFRLKCLLKIAIYSYYIRSYHPEAIIVSEEYSFTSSVLTAYCSRHNVEHINVMHGEKIFDITDAFFHFDRCYVWNEHYKSLFCDMRAEPTQFAIEKPASQLAWDVDDFQKTVDYTYYLGGETHKKLLHIWESLFVLKSSGYIIAVRPHPRYNSIDEVKKIFRDFIIEEPQQVSVRDSILRTRNAVSLNSTVLGLAHANGVNIIIDDVTDKKNYDKLLELRYYYVSHPHDILSSHIDKCSDIKLQGVK